LRDEGKTYRDIGEVWVSLGMRKFDAKSIQRMLSRALPIVYLRWDSPTFESSIYSFSVNRLQRPCEPRWLALPSRGYLSRSFPLEITSRRLSLWRRAVEASGSERTKQIANTWSFISASRRMFATHDSASVDRGLTARQTDEASASSDEEVVGASTPGMAMIPTADC